MPTADNITLATPPEQSFCGSSRNSPDLSTGSDLSPAAPVAAAPFSNRHISQKLPPQDATYRVSDDQDLPPDIASVLPGVLHTEKKPLHIFQSPLGIKVSLLSGMDVLLRPTPKPPQGAKRGRVKDFSVNARRRFRQFLRSIPSLWDGSTRWCFASLTYGRVYPSTGEEAKRDLNHFFTRFRQLYPDMSLFWVQEFQGRGAVHFHLIFRDPSYHHRFDRVQLAQGFEILSLRLRSIWHDIAGHGQRAHFEHGLKLQRVENVTGKLTAYINKVSRYLGKQDQSVPPSYYSNIGRYWGHSKDLVPHVTHYRVLPASAAPSDGVQPRRGTAGAAPRLDAQGDGGASQVPPDLYRVIRALNGWTRAEERFKAANRYCSKIGARSDTLSLLRMTPYQFCQDLEHRHPAVHWSRGYKGKRGYCIRGEEWGDAHKNLARLQSVLSRLGCALVDPSACKPAYTCAHPALEDISSQTTVVSLTQCHFEFASIVSPSPTAFKSKRRWARSRHVGAAAPGRGDGSSNQGIDTGPPSD